MSSNYCRRLASHTWDSPDYSWPWEQMELCWVCYYLLLQRENSDKMMNAKNAVQFISCFMFFYIFNVKLEIWLCVNKNSRFKCSANLGEEITDYNDKGNLMCQLPRMYGTSSFKIICFAFKFVLVLMYFNGDCFEMFISSKNKK